jgi:hypothetical protein
MRHPERLSARVRRAAERMFWVSHPGAPSTKAGHDILCERL